MMDFIHQTLAAIRHGGWNGGLLIGFLALAVMLVLGLLTSRLLWVCVFVVLLAGLAVHYGVPGY